MNDKMEQLIEAARRWAEFAEDLPTRSPEDDELLEAINNLPDEG